MVENSTSSLADQIKEANAAKGSKLEKLIRDNQDLDILEPEEKNDKFSYPLWLRVWWRKQHPDVTLPTTNPGGAYPEMLSQLYKRMRANPELPWGDAEAMAEALAQKAQAGKSGKRKKD